METLESAIQHYIDPLEGVVAVILFGSEAKGTAREGSDIDIAILFQPNCVPNPLDLIELRDNISDHLHRNVDLVCLNKASPVIASQIYKHGKVIRTNDKKEYDQYLIHLFQEYTDLKFHRKPLENNILKRKFYG